MSDNKDPRVGEIQARLAEIQIDGAKAAMWRTADIAYLLAELADRDEKLARVEGLAERWAGLDNSPAARSNRMRTLRAAVAAAKGTEDAHD